MPLDAANYRAGLIETGILLLLLLLAFGAITIMARQRWLALGVTESLLARLAAATLVASAAVGGLSGILLSLVQGSAFAAITPSSTASRNPAVLGIRVGRPGGRRHPHGVCVRGARGPDSVAGGFFRENGGRGGGPGGRPDPGAL